MIGFKYCCSQILYRFREIPKMQNRNDIRLVSVWHSPKTNPFIEKDSSTEFDGEEKKNTGHISCFRKCELKRKYILLFLF